MPPAAPTSTPHSVLAEYFAASDAIYLFIVRADRQQPAVVAIPTQLDDLRRYVRSRFGAAGQGGSPVRELDEAEWQARLEPLIAPVLSWCDEGDTLWLAPHDVLHYLPLHAVQVQGRYLIERHPVCYTPSASVMKYCRAKRKGRRDTALVLGDSLGDLPFSRLEAQRVAALFAGEPLLHDAANRQALVAACQAEAGGQTPDVIHIACHGRFDFNQALRSGLLLHNGHGEDLLTAEEIFGLQLHAELVTLSACESGVNERRPGDELIGLTRALIYAGAPSLLVSLWSVDDLSTGLLMQQFYARWRSDRQLSKAQALQEAQNWLRGLTRDAVLQQVAMAQDAVRSLLATPAADAGAVQRLWFRLEGRRLALEQDCAADVRPFGHLFHWAPFVLVGDWQ